MQQRIGVLGTVSSLLLWLGVTNVLSFGPPEHSPLADFDSRTNSPVRPAGLETERRSAVAKLQTQVPDTSIDWDALTGSPKWIRSRHGFLGGPGGQGRGISTATAQRFSSQDQHRALKAFLDDHAAVFGHGAEVLNEARHVKDFTSPHSGLRTVVWHQSVDGLPVFEGLLIAHTTKSGELVSVSSRFVPNGSPAANQGRGPRATGRMVPAVSAPQAIVSAAASLGENIALANIVLQANAADPLAFQLYSVPGFVGNAAARLVWMPMDHSTLRLGWEVILKSRELGEMFQLLIDAETGEATLRRSLTSHLANATYRVFIGDSPSPFSPGHPTPLTNQPPLAARSLMTLAALDTNASPLGWITSTNNQTRGNNVDAYVDYNADELPDGPRPQGSPFRVFDFPLDLTQSPLAYSNAAVVQLFYWCNWMHDRLYQLGFTEAAGNFQNDNFGHGGIGGDPVLAEAQDGSAYNNDYFDSPPDGLPGRMQVSLYTGTTPFRDSDYDAGVILHEYTHGLSSRLVGGGAGFTKLQSRGMSEGWSDFFALAMLSKPGDDVNGNYPIGAYVAFRPPTFMQNYYFGYRRYPYSTDLTKNPLTLKDTDPLQASDHAGVPHSPIINIAANNIYSLGELWCVTLWEMRAKLVSKYGYAVGNQLTMQLITDGLKLSPPDPTFLQARDAILLADRVMNGYTNYFDLWAAFAKRGLGYSASVPASLTTAGVQEAFDLPDVLLVSPQTGFTALGPVGGPFVPSFTTLTLTNLGTSDILWLAANTSSWLTVSSPSGTLSPGGPAASITVSVNDSALALPAGIYNDTVTITDQSTSANQSLNFSLRIGQPDFFTELYDSQTNALAYQTFSFTPDSSVSFYSVCRQPATHFLTDPAGGTPLTLSDDGFAIVSLAGGRQVSIYNSNATVFYVGANGYVNFGMSDTTSSASFDAHFSLPRVSALFDDLDPSAGGTVSWKQLSDRVAVTFANVPLYGTTHSNSFQIEMSFNGAIRLTYLAVTDQHGLVGLSAGEGTPANFYPSDFGAYDPCTDPLTLKIPKHATEGDGVLVGAGQVAIPSPIASNLTVHLTSSDNTQVLVPPDLTILAGATTVTFDVTILDNGLLSGTQNPAVIASAAGYHNATNFITVFDAQSATLSVVLPASAVEGVGSVQGQVQVSAPPGYDVQVALTTSYTDEIQVPPSVLIPAGQTSALFTVLVYDEHEIDGPETVTVTAHVQNWVDGTGAITILDNEDTRLRLTLPAQAFEGDGLLPDAGVVRIAGVLPTNLVVALACDHPANMVVPTAVVVPAGQTSEAFDLAIQDTDMLTSNVLVTVTATARGFTAGSSVITLLSETIPSAPIDPYPPDLSSNISIYTALSWRVPVRDLIVNGDFETGDFSSWSEQATGSGGFYINDGTYAPISGDGPQPPLTGNYSVITDQTGPGQHVLSQDITIPGGIGAVSLRWSQMLHNHASDYAINQRFRVEIRDLSDEVLAVAFSTAPGDPLLTSWVQKQYDLSPFRGRAVRLAFVEEDGLGYFNVQLDGISLIVSPREVAVYDIYLGPNPSLGPDQYAGSTTNTYWTVPPLTPLATYYWQVVPQGGDRSRRPVWRFTTRGVDHFLWDAFSSPQRQNQPFTVAITAQDEWNNTVTNFTGPASLSAYLELPDVAIGDGSDLSPNPMATSNPIARSQVIYLAGELFGATRFVALSMNVAALPGQTLSHWTIRMKHTSLSAYPAAGWETNDWITVYQHNETVDNQGWATFVFDTPFDYDGLNNLMIDFSFNNAVASTDGACSTTTTFNARSLIAVASAQTGDPLTWHDSTPPAAIVNQVPNIKLTPYKPPIAVTPTNSGQFTDGRWVGTVAIPQAGSSMTLVAKNAEGHAGYSLPFSVIFSIDSDNDGMPDDWEVQHGLNPSDPSDAAQDNDSDGLTNLQEFLAGTDPNDATSVLRIVSTQWNGPALDISFTTISSKHYRLKRSATLGAGAVWTIVDDYIPGNGGVLTVSDFGASGQPIGFYRIQVLP